MWPFHDNPQSTQGCEMYGARAEKCHATAKHLSQLHSPCLQPYQQRSLLYTHVQCISESIHDTKQMNQPISFRL